MVVAKHRKRVHREKQPRPVSDGSNSDEDEVFSSSNKGNRKKVKLDTETGADGKEHLTFGNVYNKIPKKFTLPDIHYDLEKQMHWELPSMNLIVGPTGAGKTNICYDLIHKSTRGKHPAFEEVFLFAANLQEPIWDWIVQRSKEIKKRGGPQVLWYSNRLYDLPSVTSFQDIPKDKKTSKVIIIDDFVNASDDEMKRVEDWMKMGRKEMATVIFLTQSFFRTNKFVRDQVRYIWMRGLGNETDLHAVIRTFPQLVDKEVLSKIYHGAVDPWPNALCIDTRSKDPNMTFRKTYTPIDIGEYLDEDQRQFQEGSAGISISLDPTKHQGEQQAGSGLKRKAGGIVSEIEEIADMTEPLDEDNEGAIEWLERITKGYRQPEKRRRRA